MSEMRLDKFLSQALGETRSEVKRKLKMGLISVNETVQKRPEQKIDPDRDQVSAGGRPVFWEEWVWLMFNKPQGCVTATEDRSCRTVMDFIGHPRKAELFPVGRLDADTEGLLLLTNDGGTAHRLLSPKHHVPKTYFVRVNGRLGAEDVRAFKEGIEIGEKQKTLPTGLEILKGDSSGNVFQSEAKVTVCEGKFHQIKRMFAKRGCEVTYLKRISMGGLPLDETLPAGAWRELTKEERALLQEETEEASALR